MFDYFVSIVRSGLSIFADILLKVNKIAFNSTKAAQRAFKNSPELKTRVYTGSAFGFIFIIAIFLGKIWLNMFLFVLGLVMYQEWLAIIAPLQNTKVEEHKMWMAAGIAYVVIPIASLVTISGIDAGKSIIFWYFCVIWATDTGAYFIGRKIGGRKLAPNISPGKTLSGALGGVVSGCAAGLLLSFMIISGPLGNLGISGCGFVAIIVSLLAQASDILESWVKRRFGVKDSGQILPGHGGIMDRMDSITLSAPFLLCMLSNISFEL